jgi:hypothetical protein
MNKHINILFAILAIFALVGCENPVAETPVSSTPSASGSVVVSIQTPDTAGAADIARTVYPALDGFSRYELSFSGGPVAHAPVAISVDGNSPIELAVGTWTISVTAYKDTTASARGSATVTVSAGAPTPVSIILGPIPEGSNGTFSYSVASPSDATGSLTIQTISGDAVTGGAVALAAGTTSANTLSLPPGEYMLFVNLTKSGNHAGRADVLHIYSGLTSEVSYTFTDDDFIGVETLNPEYAAFTDAAGATALPSNAAAINTAKGGNTAVFAIASGTGAATINASTGELTMGSGGTITVSLTITTAGGVVTHMGTSANITVTKTVAGAAITGLTGVLQIGETAGTITAASTESGTKVWVSSNTSVATIDSSTGAVTALTAGSTTIRYTVMTGNVATSNSAVITIYAAAQTLDPTYAAFIGAAGAMALPSNAAAINTATGGDTAVFAIASGAGAATINTSDVSTGKLTMGSGGTITVSLTITTAGGVVTHKGTSANITVTKTVAGAAITGLTGVLQIGETTTATAASTQSGTKVWASSNTSAATINASTGVVTINASTGVVTLVGAGDTTISYTATEGNVLASNSAIITVYAAAQTLIPTYAAFFGIAGATALPSNADAINTAKGGNAAIFAIASGTGAATIGASDTSTGKLTMGSGGTITVSLRITTAAGVITHKGTSANITVTLSDGVGLYIDANTSPEAAAGRTLASAFVWLGTNAASNRAYTIVLGANENSGAITLTKAALHNADQVSITLRGKDAERTIQLTGQGSLFTIHNYNNSESAALTLILDQNITLKGVGSNTVALVTVNTGGTLEMRDDAKISGNTASGGFDGGGVNNLGTFTMTGGVISGNTSNGGIQGYGATYSYGGGVTNDGTFTMTGGVISGNIASGGDSLESNGGGVYNGGTFTMEGGEIYDNTASVSGGSSHCTYGGGVDNRGTFTMTGGKIYGNTAFAGSGVSNRGTFTMKGGEIYDNTGSSNSDYSLGGGVFNWSGTFTMTMIGGTISGNTASNGGGVYNDSSSGIFTKTSGTIYGDTNTTHTAGSTENTATSGNGHAVYVSSNKKRNSTAGTSVNLDSATTANWE